VTEERVERRLAAILAADVAGYSRLTCSDEEGTLARLKALRQELIDPSIARSRGRVVKTMGDGILIEFPSAVDAVRCAIEVQRGMGARNAGLAPERRIEFRVGIHVGDVVIDGADLLGDGVNIAARLEALSETGRICISEDAWRQVQGKITAAFVDLGEKPLKNIARPIRVYRVETGEGLAEPGERPALPLPDKPSIAVLPFQNMSGDPEQEYFADGVVEDIITALSRIKWLFVIARNSSFAYKGKSPDLRQVGRELGVRYVLEGSVRKASGRVRITAQLIDATNGAHIWAERFEGSLEDIFDLQDQVTGSVIGAIEPALRDAEMHRSETKPTSSLSAYDYYLRALAAFHRSSRSDMADALMLARKAIAIDPRYAVAYGLAAWSCLRRRTHGWAEKPETERQMGAGFAVRAIECGGNDPEALFMAGLALPYLAGDMVRAIDVMERSLGINQNSAIARAGYGFLLAFCGDGARALQNFNEAMRLNPLDPEAFTYTSGIAWAHFVEGRYVEAVDWVDRALREQPRFMASLRVKMAVCGLLGRLPEASDARRIAIEVDPAITIGKCLRITPLQRPEHVSAYREGLRKAGLPE
jgi:TolB-like protein/class 3 adenylate cyclase